MDEYRRQLACRMDEIAQWSILGGRNVALLTKLDLIWTTSTKVKKEPPQVTYLHDVIHMLVGCFISMQRSHWNWTCGSGGRGELRKEMRERMAGWSILNCEPEQSWMDIVIVLVNGKMHKERLKQVDCRFDSQSVHVQIVPFNRILLNILQIFTIVLRPSPRLLTSWH